MNSLLKIAAVTLGVGLITACQTTMYTYQERVYVPKRAYIYSGQPYYYFGYPFAPDRYYYHRSAYYPYYYSGQNYFWYQDSSCYFTRHGYRCVNW